MIGHHVVAQLVGDGHDVVSADRAHRRFDGAETRVVDFRRREDLYALLEGADAVVHLANHPNSFSTDPQTLLSENLAINVNVCQAAADLGVGRIVFASSIQTVSGVPPVPPEGAPVVLPWLPADGDTPARPGNIYGLSKMLTEQMLAHYSRLHGLSAVAIRFPWVCGNPRHLRHFAGWETLDRHRVNELGAWLWVEDAARLVSAILKTELPGFRVYLPTGPLPASFGAINEIVRRHYAHVPRKHPDQPLKVLIDIGQITRETGWTPCSIEEITRRMQEPEKTRG